ncbi:MAG: pyridoxamine 5'-phosphate oxidase family protein [Planctomycetota bacterium]
MPQLISAEVARSIEECVLCWLATVSEDGTPNVSPKEAFLYDGRGRILIANIASPVTVRNIDFEQRVCVSFVNVFVQKGYKVSGIATNLKPSDSSFDAAKSLLIDAIGGAFPIQSIIVIEPIEVAEIIAPSYRLYPDSGPLDRIRESLKTYRVAECQMRVKSEAETARQILVYGDSLSWGVIPGTRQRFEFDKRWPGVMECELNESGDSIRVIEDCLNGRRTILEDPYKPGRNGIAGLEQRIEVNSPLSLVIVALGTNDFQAMHEINSLQSAQGIREIIKSIRQSPTEPGMDIPEILIVAPPRLQTAKGEIAAKFKDAENKAIGLSEAFQEVALETGGHFLDAGSVTARSQIDGVHLDAEQHDRLGNAIASEVKRIIHACPSDAALVYSETQQ